MPVVPAAQLQNLVKLWGKKRIVFDSVSNLFKIY